MAAYEGLLLCSLLWIFSPAEELTITCQHSEDCVLPCQFQYDGIGVRVMWHTEKLVVSCKRYGNTTFEGSFSPAEEYKGRTGLCEELVLKGDATLVLRNVTLNDQGRYRCITTTAHRKDESAVVILVRAPVRKVNIQQVENRITCSSEGIYPEPELTWSTKPPSALTFENTTTVQQTDQQLYNINSSLTLSDSVTDLVYSCNVSTDRNWRRATLFKPTSLSVSDTEATIFCTSSNTPLLGLVWRFNSQIILNRIRDDASFTVSEGWRQQVKGVSGSGSLTLQDLSSNQEGTYTCELSDDEETYVTNIMVKIQGPQYTAAIICLLVAAVIFTVLLVQVWRKGKIHLKTLRREHDRGWRVTM